MSELNAQLTLTDNFSSQIMSAINSTDSFQQAVLRTRRQLEDLSRQRYEATITARDEATQQITRTKKALNDIKTNVAIMIGAKDAATDSVNRIKGHVKLLVDKPYNLVIDAVDKTKSVISSITNSIFSLKTLAAGIVFGATTKEGFDWTIGNAMSNENYSATLETVLHSKEKGTEALKWSYADAAKTPFDSSQVVAGVTQLATSGLDYTKYLNPLGDAAAAMNKPLEQAIFAMSKLKSGQYGIAVDMFRDFGISNDDWKGQGATFDKSGSLQMDNPQKAVDIVTNIINSKYGGLMEKKSSTANGMLSNMGDSISAMGRGLAGIDNNGQMMEGGLFDNFKKQLANIAPLLGQIQSSDAFAKLQKDIGQLATAGGEKLTAFLETFKDPDKVEEYEQKFKDFIAGVKEGINTVKEFGKSMVSLMQTIKPVIDMVVAHPNLFIGLFAGVTGMQGGFAVTNFIKDVKKELPLLISSLKTFGGGATGVFKGLSTLFSSIGSSIANGVKSIPGVLSTALNTARLWVGVVGTVIKNGLISALSGIGGAIMTAVRPVIAFFAANPIVLAVMAIVAVAALLYEAWTNDWGGIKEKTEAVLNFLEEGFDKFRDKLVEIKDKVLKDVKTKFDDFNKVLDDHKTAIKTTAAILGTVFGPALLATGTKAVIAGSQIAAHFITNLVKTGTQAVVNGAKVTASFVASIAKSGVEATINGAKITASFVASVIKTGTQAVISGAKVTASFIGSMIKVGTEAVISGGKITAGFIASIAKAGAQAVLTGSKITISLIGSLIKLSAQAVLTAAKITASLIASLIAYAATGWKTVASIAATTAAWVAQKATMVITTVATYALTAAQWALNIAMNANPIGIVIIAIAALGVAIYEVITHWQDIRDWIMKVWDVIDNNPILKFISIALNPLGIAIMECVTHWNDITSAIQGAWDWLTSWIDKWNETSLDDKNVNINQTVTSSSGADPGKNALGTTYWRGGLTWVGENGPELLDLNKGAKVINNRDSLNILNSTQPVNDTFSLDIRNLFKNIQQTDTDSKSDIVKPIIQPINVSVAHVIKNQVPNIITNIPKMQNQVQPIGIVSPQPKKIIEPIQSADERVVTKNNNFVQNLNPITNNSSTNIMNSVKNVNQGNNSFISEIKNKAKSMMPQASEWGMDIPKNLADGIKNNTPIVTNSVTYMANKIRELIHFTVPDKGPLSDFNTYPVDMLETFGTGIEDNVKLVTNPTINMSADVKKVYADLSIKSGDYGKQITQELGAGMQEETANLADIAKTLTDKVIETFKTGFDIHSPSRVMREIGGHVMQGFINGLSSKDLKSFADKQIGTITSAFGSAVNLPGGVADWLTQALMATGTPLSWLPGLEKLVMAESGGDPSNSNPQSVGGEHATGLLQTLPSTFEEFMQKGMNNILNPVDNAAAAINYIKNRYGDVYNTPLFKGGSYVGYATGTDYATPGYHWVGEKGPELMKFNGGEKVINNKDSLNIMSDNVQAIQKLIPTKMPQIKNLTQIINQELNKVEIPQAKKDVQTIMQNLKQVRIPNIKDIYQNIKQNLVSANIPKADNVVQTIKQKLNEVNIVNPGDILQTIRQQLSLSNIPSIKGTVQNIKQVLKTTDIPKINDVTQSVNSKLISKNKYGSLPKLLSFNDELSANNKGSKKALGNGDVKVYVKIEGNVIGNEEYADYVGEHVAKKINTILETNM